MEGDISTAFSDSLSVEKISRIFIRKVVTHEYDSPALVGDGTTCLSSSSISYLSSSL